MTQVLCVGHAVQDFVFAVTQMPEKAVKHTAVGFESIGGGPAATAAVTIAKLGGKVALAARVGDDSVGELIISDLESYGVDCRLVKRFSHVKSSVSAVAVDALGERMIMNYLDPDLPSDSAWLPESIPEGTNAVLADTRWPSGGVAMLTRAKNAGIPAVLDADKPIPKDGALLRAATHLAFSADGLADFAGHEDYKRSLCDIAAETGAWCCVTLGAEGVFYVSAGVQGHVPAFLVDTVDTLGAGDVWHGAFAQALAEQMQEEDAIRFASAAAAIKVQRFGGRRGAPTREEVNQFLK